MIFKSCGLLFEQTANISVNSFASKKEKSLQVFFIKLCFIKDQRFDALTFNRPSAPSSVHTSVSIIKTLEMVPVMPTVITTCPNCVSWRSWHSWRTLFLMKVMEEQRRSCWKLQQLRHCLEPAEVVNTAAEQISLVLSTAETVTMTMTVRDKEN